MAKSTFTLTHGMNSMNELYCKKRKGRHGK